MVFWHDNDFPEPLSEEHWKEMGEISSYLRTEYPKESENWYGKPEDWAAESHEIAVNFKDFDKENCMHQNIASLRVSFLNAKFFQLLTMVLELRPSFENPRVSAQNYWQKS